MRKVYQDIADALGELNDAEDAFERVDKMCNEAVVPTHEKHRVLDKLKRDREVAAATRKTRREIVMGMMVQEFFRNDIRGE